MWQILKKKWPQHLAKHWHTQQKDSDAPHDEKRVILFFHTPLNRNGDHCRADAGIISGSFLKFNQKQLLLFRTMCKDMAQSLNRIRICHANFAATNTKLHAETKLSLKVQQGSGFQLLSFIGHTPKPCQADPNHSHLTSYSKHLAYHFWMMTI